MVAFSIKWLNRDGDWLYNFMDSLSGYDPEALGPGSAGNFTEYQLRRCSPVRYR